MLNYYYKDSICSFLTKSVDLVIGEIQCLQEALQGLEGTIFFEFSVPRMEKGWMQSLLKVLSLLLSLK